MAKTIAIIGTLDTKGPELAFLKAEIEKRGCRTPVINVGVLGTSMFVDSEGDKPISGLRFSCNRQPNNWGE